MATAPEILRIRLMFEKLTARPANFPSINTLSSTLNNLMGNGSKKNYPTYKKIDTTIASYFATASVEMWHRAIHSFFISASLTQSSPIWSSVAGYYSSHYTMRAFAHLFGCYQLFSKKVVMQLDLSGQTYICHVEKKGPDDREHTLYWKRVKEYFKDDFLFTVNPDMPPGNFTEFRSDGAHRSRANYTDHIGNFPVFKSLDEQALKIRLKKLSTIDVNEMDIPNVLAYPDITNVQLVAYHRILKYRAFLDQLLPTNNRFWSVQRNPNWAPNYFEFKAAGTDYSGISESVQETMRITILGNV